MTCAPSNSLKKEALSVGGMIMSTIVNSWNEWDPLKHVIVGRADDCHIPPEEPALDAKVPEDSDMRG